jgi:hypothetical protein
MANRLQQGHGNKLKQKGLKMSAFQASRKLPWAQVRYPLVNL